MIRDLKGFHLLYLSNFLFVQGRSASRGEPAEKRREGRLLKSKGQVVVVLENDRYRANGEASCARVQPSRTFGFVIGFESVFVSQVEAYREDFLDRIFADTSLTFGSFFLGRCRLGGVHAHGLRICPMGRQVGMNKL